MRRVELATPRIAYVVGLAVIVVLLCCQFIGTRILSEKQQASAVEINLAGRQRMLSQRIPLTVERLRMAVEAGDTDQERFLRMRLRACADLMDVSYVALVSRVTEEMSQAIATGGACLVDGTPPSDTRPPPAKAVAEAPVLQAFTAHARDLATNRIPLSEADAALLSDNTIEALLNELDAATMRAQKRAIDSFRWAVIANWAFLILFVLGGALLIFRPLVRRVEQSIRDLTSANEKLRESERRLKDFAGTGAHLFWETGPDHAFTWVEDAGRYNRVKDKSLFVGRTRWDVASASGSTDGIDWEAHKKVLNSHKRFENFEYSVVLRDGVKVWWSVHGRPLFDAAGRFTGYRGTSREVTAEKLVELQTRQAERMQSLGQLTAGVAHDFNNLLAIVQGNAELIDKEHDSLRRKVCIDEIVTAVEGGAALTGRLLAFGRVQDLNAETIELGELFADVAVLLEQAVGATIEIDLQQPPPGLCVSVDRHQLENAFINIALNAKDACTKGGRFTVSAAPLEWTPATAGAKSGLDLGRLVCITFQDNGCGIGPDALGKVFEPFYSTKPVGQGSGLGLSMVYGFALQSEGFVDISSQLEVGTTVRLCLPMVPGAQRVPPKPDAPTATRLEGKRVLVIEDDSAVRKVARLTLESMGMSVVETPDAQSALDAFARSGRFDLVLADVVLPGRMNGIEVAHKLREMQPDLQVLFMSGYAGEQDMAGAQADVSDPLLKKPFSRAELEKQIALLQTGVANQGQRS